MAPPIGVLNNEILVKFNYPDGSTSWDFINYEILVKFNYPDGSTSQDYINYDI